MSYRLFFDSASLTHISTHRRSPHVLIRRKESTYAYRNLASRIPCRRILSWLRWRRRQSSSPKLPLLRTSDGWREFNDITSAGDVLCALLTLPEPVNAYRSSKRGAGAELLARDEAGLRDQCQHRHSEEVLTNDETITYTNNSPDLLTELVDSLEQEYSTGRILGRTTWARRWGVNSGDGRWRSARPEAGND